jgi:hypothetical protein
MGQMLSFPLFLLGTTMVVLWLRKKPGANT